MKAERNSRIGGQSGVVCCESDQLHPASALPLGQGEPDVLRDHVGVPAVMLAVLGRAAKYLAQPQRHVMGMIGWHVGEHRAEDLIALHMTAIEDLGQPVKRLATTGPLIDGWRLFPCRYVFHLLGNQRLAAAG